MRKLLGELAAHVLWAERTGARLGVGNGPTTIPLSESAFCAFPDPDDVVRARLRDLGVRRHAKGRALRS